MKLSIVSTLYKSAPYVSEFHQRATGVAKQLAGDDYEIVLVNDGSPDDSLELAVKITHTDEHLLVVDLSRNFGHHKAMMSGLAHAKGDLVFLIDSDLEEEPEWLAAFAEQMRMQKCDVVFGVQEQRKGGWFERHSGQLFYRVFRALTRMNLPDNIVVARLMTRGYVDALLLHGESEVFMAGLWVITGFDQRQQTVKKHSTSETTYTLWKKLSQLVDSITSFSNVPLVGIFIVGCVIFAFAGCYTAYLVVNWLFFSVPPTGYTSLMASIWLLGGMITAFIGIVGVYLSKIFSETKRRPNAIVRRIYQMRLDRETA